MLDRRQFLCTTAGLSAAALGCSRKTTSSPATDLPANLGIQMYTLRNFDNHAAFDIVQDLGLTHVELHSGVIKHTAPPAEVDALVADLKGRGLTITAFSMPKFSADHDANRPYFEFAKRLGAPCISCNPDLDSFDSLDKLVDEYDVRLAIHNHGPRHRYNKATDVYHAFKDHDERIGACADLGHFIRSAEDPLAAMRLLGKRLYGIHVKDFKEQTDESEHAMLGEGHLDVIGMFDVLKAIGFPANGALSLEYEGEPDNPVPYLRKAVAKARESAEKAGYTGR